MTTLFLVCAALGSGVLLLNFVLGLIGHGHLDGVGHGLEHAGGGGGHDDSGVFFGVLSLRAIAAGLAAFGIGGMASLTGGLAPAPSAGLGLVAGGAAMSLVVLMLRTLRRMNAAGTVDTAAAVDQIATVYVPIPGDYKGTGKITLDVQNRTLELSAVTHGTALATGARVRVVQLVDPSTAEVSAIGVG